MLHSQSSVSEGKGAVFLDVLSLVTILPYIKCLSIILRTFKDILSYPVRFGHSPTFSRLCCPRHTQRTTRALPILNITVTFLYTAHWILVMAHCTLYNKQRTLHTAHCTLYNVPRILYTEQWQCIVCIMCPDMQKEKLLKQTRFEAKLFYPKKCVDRHKSEFANKRVQNISEKSMGEEWAK